MATGACLQTHNQDNNSTFPDYPQLNAKKELRTDYNIIYFPDPNDKEKKKELINVPGLWIQGCSFENLEAGSQWTEEGLEILRMYGGKMEAIKLGGEGVRKKSLWQRGNYMGTGEKNNYQLIFSPVS